MKVAIALISAFLLGWMASTAFAEQRNADGPWTILVYGAADNSADKPLIGFLHKIRRAIDDDPGIELLVFIDRSEKKDANKPAFLGQATFLGEDFTGARLYRVRKDSVERLSGGDEFPEITVDKDAELNSADARNIGRFVAWGKRQSAAQHYALLIYSHANGRIMCPDDTSKADMGIAELTDKVREHVDFLALELCSMGGIEIAYQWRPGNGGFEVDVMLAIPNAGPPLDWDRAFSRIRTPGHETERMPAVDPSTMSSADFGRLVIEEGFGGRQTAAQNQEHLKKIADKFGGKHVAANEESRLLSESAGCYDLRFAGDVKKAVDALSVDLARAGARSVVLELCGHGSDGGAMRYDRDDSKVDLYDLSKRIWACGRLPDPVRDAAKNVMDAVERFMIGSFGMSDYKGFEAGKNGVYIVVPSGEPRSFAQFAWYTPLAGPGRDYGRWSFLKDGAIPGNGAVENWFELIDSWFDEADDKGGSNGYRP
jgi:clostripain